MHGTCDGCGKDGPVKRIESGHLMCTDCLVSMAIARDGVTGKDVRHIYSKVVGVSHHNKDRRGRQRIIRDHCRDGMPLLLECQATAG